MLACLLLWVSYTQHHWVAVMQIQFEWKCCLQLAKILANANVIHGTK